MVVQMLLLLFLHALLLIAKWRDWLHYLVVETALGTKKRKVVKIYKPRLLRPHSQKNERRNYQPKKNYSKSKKKNLTWQWRTRDLCFYFILLILNRFSWLINFLYFLFPWLIINHKHKCIQAKTLETQVSWSLDTCTY